MDRRAANDPAVGPRASRARRALIAVAATALLLAVVWLLFSFGIGSRDAQVVAERVRAWGGLGPLALLALLVVQAVVAPLPSPPLLMAAGFVYGPLVGFGIGWLGLLLGAVACFALARAFGRPFAERFVRPERLAAVDRIAGAEPRTAFLGVLSLRVFLPPVFDAVSYGCGLVRLPLHVFVLATALGEVPKVASFTYLGAAAGAVPSWLTAWILLVPLAGLVGLRLVRRALRAPIGDT